MQGVDSSSEVYPPGLICLPNGELSRTRRWVKLTGLAPASKLGVFNNNLNNGYKAFAERYMLCKTENGFEPALKTSMTLTMCKESVEHLQEVVDALELAPVATTHEVAMAYTGPKRKLYLEAERKYWTDGVKRMDAILHSFVKFEKTNLLKAPRVINPRSPVYNLALGRYLKLNEKNYYKAIASVFGQENVIIKGMDSYESARQIKLVWDQFSDPIAIGGDATKFDMHVSLEALYYEHLHYLVPYVGSIVEAIALYDRVIVKKAPELRLDWSDAEQLAWLLSLQLQNFGTAYFDDGKLKFRMRGTRASGDLNTSLGNCILMCAMARVWSKRTGVRMMLINNGDDCVFVMERKDEGKWREGILEYYRSKGFRMVLEETAYELEEIEFCQSRPCWTEEGYTMVRNPLTLIEKGSMCLQPVGTTKQLRRWMMAVGVCEGSLAKGVPVVSAFARAMRRNGAKCSTRYIKHVYAGSSRAFHSDFELKESDISAAARTSFWMAWGILPREQEALEAHFAEWSLDRSWQSWGEDEAIDKFPEPIAPITHLLCPAN